MQTHSSGRDVRTEGMFTKLWRLQEFIHSADTELPALSRAVGWLGILRCPGDQYICALPREISGGEISGRKKTVWPKRFGVNLKGWLWFLGPGEEVLEPRLEKWEWKTCH